MTTIAADAKAGVMACDSQWSDGTEKGITRKVWRVRGCLVGLAGDTKACEQVRAWLRADRKTKTPTGDVSALILEGRRLYTWEPQNGLMEHGAQFAIGSGGAEARAAMMAGADVRTAVRIACKIDSASGGPVRSYRL